MKKILVILFVGAIVLASCKKKDDTPTPDNPTSSTYHLFYEGELDNDYSIKLYSYSELIEVGYNHIFIVVKQGDNLINNASVELSTMMDMGNMHHGSPVVQPHYNSSTKQYEGVAIFTMAGAWELMVSVNNEEIAVPIEVAQSPSGTKYVGSYMDSEENKYILTLVKPFDWEVGQNEIQLMIHKESMHDFIPIDDFEIEMDPQMMSMGHGSPNNTNPVSIGNGYYKGEVNFTMTGDWRIYLVLSQDSEVVIEQAYFEIMF